MHSSSLLLWRGNVVVSELPCEHQLKKSQPGYEYLAGPCRSVNSRKASSLGSVATSSSRTRRAECPCHGVNCRVEDAQSPSLPAEGDMPAGRPAGACRRAFLASMALSTSVAASADPVTTGSNGLASLGEMIGLQLLPAEAKEALVKADEEKLLEQNKKIQRLNGAPANFPSFIREGFNVKVVIGPEYVTTPSGLVYLDIIPGSGDTPKSGQQVIFHYIGYNEQGRRVDSTYLKGAPARTRVGINGLIPGFEEGISSMQQGGKRRIVIPPELGPPTGPSTFFSAKLYEVFDVELISVTDCVRRQVAFYSDVVCQ